MNQLIPTGLLRHRNNHFASNFIKNCVFEVKKPADCSMTELHHFYRLVRMGNKVSAADLHQKISNCDYLAFCYQGEVLIGISAIKRPEASYLKLVFAKAGISRSVDGRIQEIGYSFTVHDFRRKGIGSTLKTLLLNKIIGYEGLLFSTTASQSSQRFLQANGFVPCGHAYDGIFDSDIIYFEHGGM
ncbi:hypothetical protein [Pedobacter aquatilis]|uniref:hypothetical protein n=1 Tax=Pedobacter aquatilis TaxID=351343 RepID=UPI00292DFEBD|nr:hypothetical protein [Pedobacter aquatilis]